MAADEPQLTDGERELVAHTLWLWAHHHPRRDEPVILLADGSRLTPGEIGEAVRTPDSPRGRLLFSVFAGVHHPQTRARMDVEQLMEIFMRDAARWAQQRRHWPGPPRGAGA